LYGWKDVFPRRLIPFWWNFCYTSPKESGTGHLSDFSSSQFFSYGSIRFMEAAVLVFLFSIGMPESHFLDADSVRPARGGG
jgi:hypothetical protein